MPIIGGFPAGDFHNSDQVPTFTNQPIGKMPKTKTSREEILRATWAEFHRTGYADTSLQQLANAAGLGKAGLLHHFGSKEGLMRAVIEFVDNWYGDNVLAMVDEPGTVEERLERFLRRHLHFCQLNDGGGCFFANMILETGVTGQFAPTLQNFHAGWEAAMIRLLSERFPAEEARERTYRLFADYQGSVVLFKLYRDPVHLERLVTRSIRGLQHPI
ncbi:TetR family transcriptional regulator [Lewinella sp. W8]|nr:TetR family transcriptional regulator [Lewinella sp. W8]